MIKKEPTKLIVEKTSGSLENTQFYHDFDVFLWKTDNDGWLVNIDEILEKDNINIIIL